MSTSVSYDARRFNVLLDGEHYSAPDAWSAQDITRPSGFKHT